MPICIVPASERHRFADFVSSVYADLTPTFIEWLHRPEDLIIAWVMGFKPAGDDARPDRGLVPFARMLLGLRADLLTVVYGPAQAAMWALFVRAPGELRQQNGLWESILGFSDAVLIDSATDGGITRKGYTAEHWKQSLDDHPERVSFLVSPRPLRLGEQDVDTVLHLLFTRLGGLDAFEGMCNPPGGDWSGISLQLPDRGGEARWLSLPRVTGPGSKRPDHVIQVFRGGKPCLALVVESKEAVGTVESGIGPRLSKYLADLLAVAASVVRESRDSEWRDGDGTMHFGGLAIASVVAFQFVHESDLVNAANKADADLVIGVDFADGGRHAKLRMLSCTDSGDEAGQLILDAVEAASHELYSASLDRAS